MVDVGYGVIVGGVVDVGKSVGTSVVGSGDGLVVSVSVGKIGVSVGIAVSVGFEGVTVGGIGV